MPRGGLFVCSRKIVMVVNSGRASLQNIRTARFLRPNVLTVSGYGAYLSSAAGFTAPPSNALADR